MSFGKDKVNRQWSEYLIEFVMLFLAVTLGFVAENIRENISEENKRKDLLSVVTSDFEMDVDQIEFHKQFCKDKIVVADSLRNIVLMRHDQIDQQMFYRLLINFPAYWFFVSTDKSRNQADALGYFLSSSNKELAKALERYTFYYNDIKTLDQFVLKLNDRFLVDIAPGVTDEPIYFKQWRFPNRPELPSKLGIKPMKPESKEALLYYISNVTAISDTYLYNYDSLQYYAKKSISLLNAQLN